MSAPQQIGPYRVVRELARGGMGRVYEVEHEQTGVRYALKTLLPELLRGLSEESLARFRREGEAMARLRHPHVATIHAASFDDPPHLVQALLSGGTLVLPAPR